MNYLSALENTMNYKRLGKTPGLACLRRVLSRLGDPQNTLSVIHVAGTNGKGSVCAMVAQVLTVAGYRTGLYTSPFLVDFRERFRLNGEMIPRETYAALFEEVTAAAQGEELSQFDLITAIAFCWFARQKADFVVLETGLGGRLDATNVVESPLVTAITSVSMDHTALLGDTPEKIAVEKAGICKNGRPVVIAPRQPKGVTAVIRETARQKHGQVFVPDYTLLSADRTGTRLAYGGREYSLSLLGAVQGENAAVALEILSVLRQQGVNLPQEAMEEGLKTACHPGRCQVLCQDPLVILDGAHNPDGAAMLCQALTDFSFEKFIGVCGMMADKSVEETVKAMAPCLASVITVTPNNPRALSAEKLAETFAPYCPAQAEVLTKRLLSKLQKGAAPVVIFGSLYLAGEVLRIQQSDG